MAFSTERLKRQLERLPQAQRYWVAFSGGMDSQVLLHALARLRAREPALQFEAVHVDHQLNPRSAEWQQHCAGVCRQLDIPYRHFAVTAHPGRGQSPEAAARKARYDALESVVTERDMVLTAHHQDDQAETLLLQLLRGAGPHGLAAMPDHGRFGPGWLGRPLLAFSRAELRAYAEVERLTWIDDPSNSDTGFDRNFLRHEVMPRILARWPAAPAVIARSAILNAEAAAILDEQAGRDIGGDRRHLSVSMLSGLGSARRRNALRFWIHNRGHDLPSHAVMERIERDVVLAPPDAEPVVNWGESQMRRYRDALWLMRPMPDHEAQQTWFWDLKSTLRIPGAGTLAVAPREGAGLALAKLADRQIEVGFRQGGEEFRPAGKSHRQSLKKLLQEAGIPPWQRERLPILHADGALAAVADMWVADEFAAVSGEPSLTLQWTPESEGD